MKNLAWLLSLVALVGCGGDATGADVEDTKNFEADQAAFHGDVEKALFDSQLSG